jgi:hypothetical protein
MTTHKYKIGQSLRYTPNRMGGSQGGAQSCKIIRLLPQEDGQPQYRVKCTDENVERVVKEFSLSRPA